MTITIAIKNNEFVLHASGAIFWTNRRMLLIADVHLGKVSHFRKAGFAVPPEAISKNFLQLAAVMDYFQPEYVCFLGDLFHSELNTEWELFSEWTKDVSAQIILIVGNHDIISPARYIDLGIKVYQELGEDGFLFTHYPTDSADFFNFAGHIHPSVKLRGYGRQFLKLPCFFQTPNQMILPAFGEFTGTYEMKPTEDDLVYAVTKDSVVLIPKREN